jgi:hypothetical protein
MALHFDICRQKSVKTQQNRIIALFTSVRGGATEYSFSQLNVEKGENLWKLKC